MTNCSDAVSGIGEFKVSILQVSLNEPRHYGRWSPKTQAKYSPLDCALTAAYRSSTALCSKQGSRQMGNRLSKIYTRTGDDGTTGLGDGSRVAKDSVRVEAFGTVDEANSAIGVILGNSSVPDNIRTCLTEVQHDLFELGGELCIPGHSAIKQNFIDRLEDELDKLNHDLPALK